MVFFVFFSDGLLVGGILGEYVVIALIVAIVCFCLLRKWLQWWLFLLVGGVVGFEAAMPYAFVLEWGGFTRCLACLAGMSHGGLIKLSVMGVSVCHVHPDELGSPRVVSTPDQQVVWRWDSDAFGTTLPNEDPSQTGVKFSYHLRFPGQYYDVESGLHYNYFRDYDPQTGRYVQSDPIGLAGGMNTYGYVEANPLRFIDPLGLYLGEEYIGAVDDFWRNYLDMRNANNKGADKYFHCKANCEAAQRGKKGAQMACLISDGREWFDQRIKGDPESASLDDQLANNYGRSQGGGFVTSLLTTLFPISSKRVVYTILIMKKLKVVALIFIVTSVLISFVLWLKYELTIDSCLDRGGAVE